MGFRKWADFLWPIGATVLALLVMPLAIEQYPEFFKENRWPLPISVAVVVACWILPFFLHERARGIWGWATSGGWLRVGLAALIGLSLLGTIVVGGMKLFRFHSAHLASVLRKKEPKQEVPVVASEKPKPEIPQPTPSPARHPSREADRSKIGEATHAANPLPQVNAEPSLDCDFENFPVIIPANSKILVLQAHPRTVERHIPLHEVDSPPDRERSWPSIEESTPIRMPNPSHSLAPVGFRGEKCTVKQIGAASHIDQVVIRLSFSSWGNYDLVTDALEFHGSFTDFTFYMVNYCYSESSLESVSSNVIAGSFSQRAMMHIIGESVQWNVPLIIPPHDKLQPNFILPGTYHRWKGFPPC